MNKSWRVGAIAIGAGVLAGCRAGPVTKPDPIPATPSSTTTGITYFLPKTVVQIKATFKLVHSSVFTADASGKAMRFDDSKKPIKPKAEHDSVDVSPIEVSLVGKPDAKLRFRMDMSNLSSGFVGVKDSTVTLTDNGVLTGIKVPFEDKTGDIITSVLKVGLTAAKFAALAGTEAVEQDVQAEQSIMLLVDIAEFKKTQDFTYEYTVTTPFSVDEAIDPKVTIRIKAPLDIQTEVSKPAEPDGLKDAAAQGVYVRVPTPVTLEVVTGKHVRSSALATVAQGGGFSFIPIRSRTFADSSTGLSISATTGALTTFTYSSTASGAGAAKAAETAATQLAAYRGELLDAQKALLDKEKALLEAQKALDKAKQP